MTLILEIMITYTCACYNSLRTNICGPSFIVIIWCFICYDFMSMCVACVHMYYTLCMCAVTSFMINMLKCSFSARTLPTHAIYLCVCCVFWLVWIFLFIYVFIDLFYAVKMYLLVDWMNFWLTWKLIYEWAVLTFHAKQSLNAIWRCPGLCSDELFKANIRHRA